MGKSVFAGFALGIAALSVTACGSGADQTAATAPDGIPGLEVSNARMVLAPVAGNPAVVYLDLVYNGDRGLALSHASVEGAKRTVIHDMGNVNGKMQMMEALPIVLKKGEKISFAPGGKHIMAMDVSPDLKPGGTTEVTLIVSGGDKQSFPAEIRAAGDPR